MEVPAFVRWAEVETSARRLMGSARPPPAAANLGSLGDPWKPREGLGFPLNKLGLRAFLVVSRLLAFRVFWCLVLFVCCASLCFVLIAVCVAFLCVPCFLVFRVSWFVVFLGVSCLFVFRVSWRVVFMCVSYVSYVVFSCVLSFVIRTQCFFAYRVYCCCVFLVSSCVLVCSLSGCFVFVWCFVSSFLVCWCAVRLVVLCLLVFRASLCSVPKTRPSK